MESVVVFPAPLGPTIPKMEPAVTSRSIPSTATVSPKCFESPWIDSTVSRLAARGFVARFGLVGGAVVVVGSIAGGGGGGGGGGASSAVDFAGVAAFGLADREVTVRDFAAAVFVAADLVAADFVAVDLAGARLRGAGFDRRLEAGGTVAGGTGQAAQGRRTAGGRAGRSVSSASGSWSTEQPYQLRNHLHRSVCAASRIHYESSKVPTVSQTPPVQ